MELYNLRKKLKVSQQTLAKKTGIPQSSISSYETGKTGPDANALITLADFFHVSMDILAGRNFQGVDFSRFTDEKYALLSKIADLSLSDCAKVSGYIDALNEKSK